MTPAQEAVLRALPLEGRQYGRTARMVALDVWPDDPGWNRRTSGRGAPGATMPLRAGRVLAGLERRGLASRGGSDSRWWRTRAGHLLLAPEAKRG